MAVLMALNNKFGWLVLICGNKSELAVGYTTIYGVDMAGGFAVIKDVFKTRGLRRWPATATRSSPVIPESVLTKPPSAELRPDQRDDQSLPPYEVLDPILEAYVERDLTLEELLAAGMDAAHRRAHRAPRRRRRVEAAPVAARACGSRPRRSARTAASRSPTATADQRALHRALVASGTSTEP